MTRSAAAIVSGRWATITRVNDSRATAWLTRRSRSNVQRAGRFVEEEDARPLVQRAGEQQSLALPPDRLAPRLPMREW